MSAHNAAIHTFLRTESHGPGTRISNDLMHRIGADWERFREAAEALGFDATEHRATTIDPTEGDEWDYAAHDFILTRNHHGAGFWDGDWQAPWGDRLTALAHTFPQLESYFDDDDILRLL
jgi:hypothetical protein